MYVVLWIHWGYVYGTVMYLFFGGGCYVCGFGGNVMYAVLCMQCYVCSVVMYVLVGVGMVGVRCMQKVSHLRIVLDHFVSGASKALFTTYPIYMALLTTNPTYIAVLPTILHFSPLLPHKRANVTNILNF